MSSLSINESHRILTAPLSTLKDRNLQRLTGWLISEKRFRAVAGEMKKRGMLEEDSGLSRGSLLKVYKYLRDIPEDRHTNVTRQAKIAKKTALRKKIRRLEAYQRKLDSMGEDICEWTFDEEFDREGQERIMEDISAARESIESMVHGLDELAHSLGL